MGATQLSIMSRLTAVSVVTLFSLATAFPAPALNASTSIDQTGRTFVHLFEWSWDDIAQECEDWLAPHGFDAVQISPPMEHITGPQWWTRYQPVSYKLVSRSGDREQLRQMVSRCNKVGVKIYADAVFNHIAAGSGTGLNGTKFGNRAIPGIFSQDDLHHNDNDPSHNCGVKDYNNQYNVQHCDLVGLPDLCTSCAYVQQTVGEYLHDLASLGVEGFRVDAAKHQESGELKQLLSKGPGGYTFHEVISGANEAVKPSMYYSIGQVTEFNFARQLVPNLLQDGKMVYLKTFGETWGFMPSANAVTFIDNHDTQRGEAQLIYKNAPLYNLANVFMLAHPYGHPKVMSSYAFNDHDQGPPTSAVHQGSNLNCGNGEWVCEHRWPQIAGMVGFRKAAGSSKVTNFVGDMNNDAIAFSRDGKGFVLINRSSNTWTTTLTTGLAAGTYTDVLADSSDATITVGSDGKASFSVGSMHATAIHIGAKLA